ncbi:MAG: trigger factor [Clostridia bacterium]|nr:trigger factor [Clostridia bacterium]
MKLISTEKKEKNQVELSILVSKEEFEKACERSYRMNVGKINIQGFRKGKAPRKIIEKLYGPEVFYEDAMNFACEDSYYDAVKAAGITPVDRPAVTDLDIKDGEFTYKAIVTVKPEAEIGEYKGLEAEKQTVRVTEKEVEAEIERVRERNARQVTVEREVKDGDIITFDFDGYVDGVAFDGGKAEDYDLKIGSGMFIPGFEEQLIGKKAGEACDVIVTFPEDYQATELAGKEATFKCLVKAVKESVKPELDDEFAKDVSEFDTLDEYKASVKARIREGKESRAASDFEEKILDKLLEGLKCDIPEVMIATQTDKIVDDFSYRLAAQGMDMNTYLQMSGMTMESFRQVFSVQAERNVKVRLALEAVAKCEGIEISDEEVEAEFVSLAENNKMDVARVKEFIAAEDMKGDMLVQKAMEIVKSSAKPAAKKTAKKAEGEAKKPAAKKAAKKDEE